MPQSLKSNYPVKRQYSKERVKDEKNEKKKLNEEEKRKRILN